MNAPTRSAIDPAAGPDPARRQFLRLASGCVLCGVAGAARLRAATDRPIDAGTLADYPADGISEKIIQFDVFVIRHRSRLYACTAICTHKANYLLRDPKDPQRIVCSGHESTFTLEGRPTGGPAKRPLVRYAISVNEKGRVMVDTSREFPPAQWDDRASYLALESAGRT